MPVNLFLECGHMAVSLSQPKFLSLGGSLRMVPILREEHCGVFSPNLLPTSPSGLPQQVLNGLNSLRMINVLVLVILLSLFNMVHLAFRDRARLP